MQSKDFGLEAWASTWRCQLHSSTFLPTFLFFFLDCQFYSRLCTVTNSLRCYVLSNRFSRNAKHLVGIFGGGYENKESRVLLIQ